MKIFKPLFPIIMLTMFMGEVAQCQDWANLNRYRDDNAKIGLPAPGEKRIVFMGNSITDGWSQVNPEFFEGKPYINRGISGQTTPQMLLRFRADVINLRPSVVFILAGTNDIAGNTGPSTPDMIMNNIISMVELAKVNGIKVILCSVLPAFDYPWQMGLNPDKKIPELNKMIKDYADANKIMYLDCFSAMVDDRNGMKAEYTFDGVHPNKAGYEIMDQLTEAAIAKALRPSEIKGGGSAKSGKTECRPALEESHWRLTELNGKSVEYPSAEHKEVYITFSSSTESINGSGGCNTFFGKYRKRDNSWLALSEIGMTKMMCPEMVIEDEFMNVLKVVNRYSLEGNVLILKKGGKVPVAKFIAVDPAELYLDK